MSGQDEKFDIIDRAERKYAALKKILQSGGNPALPKGLAAAIEKYEKMGAVSNSMEFEEALKKSWKRISVSSDLRPKLERIANEKGPYLVEADYLGYWERWERSLE